MTKTIVLGLDGANWSLLEPWLEAGDLPNLAALRDASSWGPLTSQFPPVTSPNWRCYATGRNPAKLGVFWWEIVDREEHTIRHPTARDFHTSPLWHDLAEEGQRIAVLNFPSGYPPAPVKNGYFTAGGPGAKEIGFAYPQEWESHLRERYNYRVHPADVLRSAQHLESQLDEVLSIMQSRFDVAFDLLDEGLDFLHITIFYINVLHHFWYRGEPTRAGWQMIDRNLGRLREIAERQGYNLLLMSDHGCGPVNTVFYINTWLEREGYLSVELPPAARRLSRWGIDRRRLRNAARSLGVDRLLRDILPASLQHMVPGAGGAFRNEAKGNSIDWDNSRAIASGQGPIYLLVPPEDPAYESLRREIAAKLADLQNPITKKPVVARVLHREEVYEGPFFERAPDLVFEQGVGIHTSGAIGYPDLFRSPEKWAADNVLTGLFLAWGPDFTPLGKVEGTRIIDLAPTILHAMSMPIPDDVDGRVLENLFAPGSEASKRSVTFRPTAEEDAAADSDDDESEIAARLSALGYLD